MIRALKLFAVPLLFVTTAGAQSAPTVTKFDVAGISVILKPVTANEVIAVRMYLRGGAASLTPQNAGIEAMMLAVADHGTRKYNKDAFAALATQTGTQIGSQATLDYSVLTM